MHNMVSPLTSIRRSKAKFLTTTISNSNNNKALLPIQVILDEERLLDLTSIHPRLQRDKRKTVLMHHSVNWVLKLSTSRDHT
jgi:hypothetical protein